MIMNNSTKFTIGVGALFLLAGIGLAFVGGNNAAGIEDFDLEEDRVWSGNSGIYVHDISDDAVYIFVGDDVRCDEFDMQISREDAEHSEVVYKHDECTLDGSMPTGHSDDPEGWYHMGAIYNLEQGVSYNITTSDDFSAVSKDLIDGIVLSVLGVIFGIGGGFGCICCGVVILIIGGIMAVTSGGNKPQTQIEITPSVEVDSKKEEEAEEYDKEEKKWYEDDSS
jgi:hypothetical protein|tara:strand:- start:2260 stop:2931 length:672 start_codon:yes stop_codon:yes gene_type:complete